MKNDYIEHFLYDYWPFNIFFFKSVCSRILSIFEMCCFYWVIGSSDIVSIPILVRLMFCEYFLPSLSLPYSFTFLFIWWAHASNFDKVYYYFSYMIVIFYENWRNIFYLQVIVLFPFRGVPVLTFTFRSIIFLK